MRMMWKVEMVVCQKRPAFLKAVRGENVDEKFAFLLFLLTENG